MKFTISLKHPINPELTDELDMQKVENFADPLVRKALEKIAVKCAAELDATGSFEQPVPPEQVFNDLYRVATLYMGHLLGERLQIRIMPVMTSEECADDAAMRAAEERAPNMTASQRVEFYCRDLDELSAAYGIENMPLLVGAIQGTVDDSIMLTLNEMRRHLRLKELTESDLGFDEEPMAVAELDDDPSRAASSPMDWDGYRAIIEREKELRAQDGYKFSVNRN